MSSYRSYTPWKSNLGSSYKTGSSSAYSSRDDVSSTRYGSLATPSTYRPSFSGGTYRVKREPPTPTVTTYTSRYGSAKTEPDPTTSKYMGTTSSNLSNRDNSHIKRYTTSSTSNLSKYGSSREPSPAAIERTNRIKSREPSPTAARTIRGKSRDPSPAIDTKCKIGYGGLNSYRMSTPRSATTTTTTAPTSYSSRYGASSSVSRTPTSANMPETSISYLSVSDFRARSISRSREISNRKSNEKELEEPSHIQVERSSPVKSEELLVQSKVDEESDDTDEEKFVSVSVVTRATSPTPPGATTVHRARRIDIAKTIEKTIQRSLKKKKTLEKEIQSDRLDDPTRYSRYGPTSRLPSYSPHSEGRYTASHSPRYSASPLSTTTSKSSNSLSEAKKEDTSSSPKQEAKVIKSKLSPPKAVRVNSRQSSVENLAATNAVKALPPTAPKADSPTKSTSSSGGGGCSTAKWTNKDFRKSALNVGPTDRPRKSRTPSTGTESDGAATANSQQIVQLQRQRLERSPSACSETSNTSKKNCETKIRQRCHPKTGPTSTAAPSLSRHNSGTNLKTNSHKSCAPTTSINSATSTSSSSAYSSSGAESSGDNNRTGKQKKSNNRKKLLQSHNKGEGSGGDTTPLIVKRLQREMRAGDSNEMSSSKCSTEDENRNDKQPPAAATEGNNQRPNSKTTSNLAVHVGAAESSQSKSHSKSPHSKIADPQEKATCRLQKLSSVSNFFAERQNDTNSEPIFIESSESSSELDTTNINASNSLTEDFETTTSPANNATANTFATTTNFSTTSNDPASIDTNSALSTRNYYTNLESSEERSTVNPPHTNSNNSEISSTPRSSATSPNATNATTDNTASSAQLQVTSELHTESGAGFTSTGGQDEPSWWQDTSRQINTTSALDFNHKDDMRYRLRHIDSGEVAWWMRNDEDDTLADDDLRTLNQEDDASEATDQVQSLPTNTQSTGSAGAVGSSSGNVRKNSWWVSEANEDVNDQNDHVEVETQKFENTINKAEFSNQRYDTASKAVGGRITPEKHWWEETNDDKVSNGELNTEQQDTLPNHLPKFNGSIQLKICRVESGERPWWLNDDGANEATVEATISLPPRDKVKVPTAPNGQQLDRSSSSSKNLSDEKHWWMSGPTKKLFNVRRVDSGEKAWWQQDDDENEEQKVKVPSPIQKPITQIKRCDSAEQDWWLQDDEKETVSPMQNGSCTNKYSNVEEQETNGNDDVEVQRIINYNNNQNHFGNYSNSDSTSHLNDSYNYEYIERPPPLGHRASPDGLEDPSRNHKPTYENIPMSKVQNQQAQRRDDERQRYDYNASPSQQYQQQQQQHINYRSTAVDHPQQQQQQQQQQLRIPNHYNSKQSREKLFISRHKNIDELLGGSCRPLSPLFFDSGSFSTAGAAAGRNIFLEEITPDQVRIHDSTAQMPVIQRMERDDWDYNNGLAAINTPKFGQRTLDDAAIQVYKDGDYGAYLDLESSLAEQAEEIEGLNSSRKNSLVVRTQLSVRVHAIIEKLLSSEGSDLRRALFSLKQVFQEDKDLVHAFVALGGLNCLVRVGNGADQNYQNYILRALGQVMLYVDGMNGVMKHEPTMQWLYSLIASKYRSVVKTALKLLLVFVEYVETNCYLLVNAIHVVDKAQGTLPWSNIMRLLKDYDNADAELVIYATSLINKTLAGLTDQDSFYDESDLLEQQGMESVIQRYMSKQGTDLDLLDQLQLYEAVLKFEDGESDGIRLPENAVRTQRYRQNGNDTVERRKSRRHSTGGSPAGSSVINKVIPSPKRGTPIHGVLDEDSSGSTYSNELSNGLFQEHSTLPRDGVGVTPGLRRRRERAERHKSFLKEQQEAAANGLFAALDRREEMGQLVTAIPATVKNSSADSPPESMVLTNEAISSNNNNNSSNIISTPNTTTSATTTTLSNMPLNVASINATNNANSNNLLSPTKSLLGSNTISIINNNFDKNHQSNNSEFLTKKNLLIERNATVINGIRKNIQRGNETENRCDLAQSNNNNNNNNNNSYKKYESDANRLNTYYSQLSTPKNNQTTTTTSTSIQTAQEALAAVLSPKKTLNGFDFTQTSLSPKRTQSKVVSPTPVETTSSLNSPSSPDEVFQASTPPPWIVDKKVEPVLNNKAAVPPPPPPPPPPPDWLWSQHGVDQLKRIETLPIQKVDEGTSQENNDLLQITETEPENEDKKLLLQLQRDHTVKDLTQKLSNIPMSPTHAENMQNRIVGDMSGLISKAKEGLAKSKSKGEISRSSSVDQEIKKPEPKKSENELHWEELVRNMLRPLNLCDLDFTDLNSDDEKDVLAPRGLGGGIPPPPPPIGVPPPMMPAHIVCPPPMNHMNSLIPPPLSSYNYGQGPASLQNSFNSSINGDIGNSSTIRKNKKTVKLFWKEVREDMIPIAVGKTIWDDLPAANVDTQKLEHLFESRAKDLMTKKQQELNKSKEVIVLDHKRSNAINIAITKLPPPRAIKAAILKMDATVVTREGIDKLLNMLPTDEERGKIQEAQMANPELPLGSAEQFLLTLASISELAARLKLWAFRLDFDNSEKEIAEPLMDLKQGIQILRNNRTFKCILSTLLSVGIFLNGAPVKGFQIEYLAKVPEVKDTVHKHSLLHHLCHMVMESCNDTTDLYSEIGPITRASKADFADLAHNLTQLETECKSSWDRLKLIAKHDCPPQLKQKLVDFLADCAERIIILQIVHRRVVNRYRKFLLWLGIPQHSVAESKPNEFCRVLSEFALEYRTTRERVQQQIEKKANHRERNKTRGKMIIDVGKFKTKEDRADAELKELLGSPSPATVDGTLTWRRRRAENLRSPGARQSEENFTDGDDEILESLVKTATKAPGTRTTPRERKRTRHADRKSLRRTLKNGLTDEEKQHVAALMNTY